MYDGRLLYMSVTHFDSTQKHNARAGVADDVDSITMIFQLSVLTSGGHLEQQSEHPHVQRMA
jgi:hypothetical protein